MMKREEHFWFVTFIRGFVALITGSAIMVIPDMAKTLLLRPFAIVMAILGLAVYGVLDSVLITVTSYMTSSRPVQIALRLQGMVGITVGVLLYVVFFNSVGLHWFLMLIVLQSLSTAIGELIVARHSPTHTSSRWNLTASTVAFIFCALYLYLFFALGVSLPPRDISWFIFGYLLAFGIAQCLTAARMLYADHSIEPPSHNAILNPGA